MSIISITWQEFYRTAQACRYQHPQVLQQQVEALKPACRDLSPYVFRDPSVGALLIAKGKMLEATPDGRPPVHFAITMKPQFPNAYPILSIEPPPAGWRIANHPNVDREGLCFLQSVTNWNPRQSTIFNVCAELQQHLSAKHPYERGGPPTGGAPPPPPQGAKHPPAPQPQPQPQQHGSYGHVGPSAPPQPQQQPRPAPQPAGRPPQQQQQPRPAPTGAQAAGSGAGLALMVMGGLLTAASRPSGPTAQQHDRQRQQDREWLQRQQQQTQQQQQAHDLARQEHDAAINFAKERFVSILQGTTSVPPDSEVATPPDFGLLGRIRTHPSGAGGPTSLTRRAAPRPLAPVTDPTPEDAYAHQLAQKEQERRAKEEAEARQAPPSSGWGVGLRALSKGVSAMSKAAESAKHSVEAKVKHNTETKETQRFQLLFPNALAQGEEYVTSYHCKMICGDGVARKGYIFLTHRHIYFSTKPAAGLDAPDTSSPTSNLVAIQTIVPYPTVVSLALGNAVNNPCMHVICQDNSVRTFLEFHANKSVEYGSYFTSAVQGTALDRCYNWLDHKWRAAVPMIPAPGYPYEAQLGQGAAAPPPPPAAQPAGIQGGGQGMGIDIPMPGPMYASMTPSAPAPAAAPSAAPSQPKGLQASESQISEGGENLCAICMDEPKNCFLRPCGHVATCMGCAGQLRQCPICRSDITDRFQAFI